MIDLRAASFLLLCGCVVTGSGGALVDDGTTTSSDTTSATPPETTSSGAGETTGKLDVASPDVATMECSSIEQTTTIVDRPSDIIIVADDDMDLAFVQSIVTNLLPAVQTEGIFDANVVLIVQGQPPDEGTDFSCGAWNCRGAMDFESFIVLQRSITPGRLLTDLIDAADAWQPALRDASWKHVWALTTTLGTEGDLDALREATDAGVVVHAVVRESGVADPQGFLGLTEETGGVYAQGDFTFDDFLNPMIERIRGTALACEYDIPAPPEGLVFEPGQVNVDYDGGEGLEVVGNVASADACIDVAGGWYYDDPIDPERIIMCPQTCADFEAQEEASVEIRFGCATIPAA